MEKFFGETYFPKWLLLRGKFQTSNSAPKNGHYSRGFWGEGVHKGRGRGYMVSIIALRGLFLIFNIYYQFTQTKPIQAKRKGNPCIFGLPFHLQYDDHFIVHCFRSFLLRQFLLRLLLPLLLPRFRVRYGK